MNNYEVTNPEAAGWATTYRPGDTEQDLIALLLDVNSEDSAGPMYQFKEDHVRFESNCSICNPEAGDPHKYWRDEIRSMDLAAHGVIWDPTIRL